MKTERYLYKFAPENGIVGGSNVIKAKASYAVQYRRLSGRQRIRKTANLMNSRIEDVVRAAAGEDAVRLAKMLASGKNVSEFAIVRTSRLDIQKVRNLLYKLHSSNLADYKRVKDNKKGIYVSYWTFNKTVVNDLFDKLRQERLQKFRDRLEVETSNVNGFFLCPAACSRADFVQAEQQRFRCAECGQLMSQEDNSRTIDVLREKIKEMEAAA